MGHGDVGADVGCVESCGAVCEGRGGFVGEGFVVSGCSYAEVAAGYDCVQEGGYVGVGEGGGRVPVMAVSIFFVSICQHRQWGEQSVKKELHRFEDREMVKDASPLTWSSGLDGLYRYSMPSSNLQAAILR